MHPHSIKRLFRNIPLQVVRAGISFEARELFTGIDGVSNSVIMDALNSGIKTTQKSTMNSREDRLDMGNGSRIKITKNRFEGPKVSAQTPNVCMPMSGDFEKIVPMIGTLSYLHRRHSDGDPAYSTPHSSSNKLRRPRNEFKHPSSLGSDHVPPHYDEFIVSMLETVIKHAGEDMVEMTGASGVNDPNLLEYSFWNAKPSLRTRARLPIS
jgi:hypothetical protein